MTEQQTEAALKGMQEMMAQLIEDRNRREEEIAAERARREEERVTREREAREQMEAMQSHVERLMRVVEESKTAMVTTKSVNELSGVKLVPLSERDDIEAYLVTFERIMKAHKVDEDRWAHYLAPQLTGRAQLAFAAVPTADSANYEAIKTAILQRYDINEEAYRRRFRTATRGNGETNREHTVRLMELQRKWLKDSTTVEMMQEAIGLEQFLSTLPMEKKVWIHERKPKTCIGAGELADEYDQVRKQEPAGALIKNQAGEQPKDSSTGKSMQVRRVEVANSNARRTQLRRTGPGSVQCFECKQFGHVRRDCLERTASRKVLYCKEEQKYQGTPTNGGVRRRGLVEGQEVRDILLDTGCTRTMVHADLVPPEKFLEGDTVTIKCAHGDIALYPLANVDMEVDGLRVTVEAAVSGRLPVPVLLGKDVPVFDKLLGSTEASKDSECCLEEALVVVTRAQARRNLEEELLRREKELLSGAKTNAVQEEVGEPQQETKAAAVSQQDEGRTQLSKEQRRILRQQCAEGKENRELNKHPLEISAAALKTLQGKDKTLIKIRKAADGHPCSAGPGFYRREGLLYRRWTPPGRGEESDMEQLVLPQECRRTVLELGHEIPLAGHLGKEKTRQRILRRFYWPTLYKDVEEFCQTCVTCQKTASKKVPPAPLIPLPLISEPFTRVAMDIVGPLPRSHSGNKYVLVLCDYATRYPEAVPLRSVDAEHVAEEIIKIFARVGVPEEILTDQGSNFMSKLLAELYRLLHIHSIRTSPYHPQTDGLVERFNQTLKTMLRKAVAEEGKNWDKLIPYLLFAYREVPQASTGFSPFELLYGGNVRGPLDVLRESWEAREQSEESVVSYVIATQEKLRAMTEIVQENLGKAQQKQKVWYDKNARLREFTAGDPVLVLLPTSTSKLLAQWQGPYQVVRRMGRVTYLVDMHDKRKRKRIFHVNMLKSFQVRRPVEQSYWVGSTSSNDSDGDSDVPVWNEAPEGRPAIGEQLSSREQEQLKEVLDQFADVMQNKPGRTTITEHNIETGLANPVRLPPYRLPHAFRESVQKELKEMLESGIIEKSSSEWAAPIVLVKKKDGSLRMCVDYRRLNSVSRVDAYPMPRIDDLIDRLGKAKFITTLDLTRGYWQMPVAVKDRHKTAFTTPFGLFQFNVMPFGLNGAPASFQRMMDQVISGLYGFAAAYLDDLVVFSSTWEEHVEHVQTVLRRLREAGLTAKPRKCQFGMDQCTYLGHIVGGGKVQPEASKVEAVEKFAVPDTKKQVRAFLGLTGYYRKFIPNYATVAAPLTDLTRKSAPNNVQWNERCEEAFGELKKLLCTSPVLRNPDFLKPFVLQTDASDRGVGAVLSQKDENDEDHPVGYFSRKLLPREERYSTVEKECLAIKLGVQAFRVYLLGRQFTIQTDHRSLEWLHRLKENNSRLTRWSLALQPYTFVVEHRAGVKNGNADALSRVATN